MQSIYADVVLTNSEVLHAINTEASLWCLLEIDDEGCCAWNYAFWPMILPHEVIAPAYRIRNVESMTRMGKIHTDMECRMIPGNKLLSELQQHARLSWPNRSCWCMLTSIRCLLPNENVNHNSMSCYRTKSNTPPTFQYWCRHRMLSPTLVACSCSP